MKPDYEFLADRVRDLAAELPASELGALAEVMGGEAASDEQALRARAASSLPDARHRSLAVRFLGDLSKGCPSLSPQAVATALMVAATAESSETTGPRIELVWTGPDTGELPLRRTEQALLQLIDEARSRLLVVSYAVYHIPRISRALIDAAGRGVATRIVLESPDEEQGKAAYSTLSALGGEVAECCEVLVWPSRNRSSNEAGRQGILHVKAAVADGNRLFLSSANLTEYAFTTNMELGLLVTGGRAAADVERHFDRLAEEGVLVPVADR